MKTKLLLLLLCLSGNVFCQGFLNLDFEYAIHGTQKPQVWFAGGNGYNATLDSEVKQNGLMSLKIESNNPAENQFGVCTGFFPVEIAKGKVIEFSGWIKTKEVSSGFAGLWWRVDGQSGVLGFDNMHDRGISGTTDWKKVSIEMKVDPNVTNINFGALFPGQGTAWFDNFEVTVDGKKLADGTPRESGPTAEELKWLKDNIYPLKSCDPNAPVSDLKILDKLVDGARVVALGETTHGAAEIFKMKDRIIRYLSSNLGFDIFSIEANMPESYKINDYTVRSTGDPVSLIKGMYFWTWRTQEVLSMVEWMKKYNGSGGKISFTGFDMQYHQGSINELKEAFADNANNLETIDRLGQLLDNYANQNRNTGTYVLPVADKREIEDKISQLRSIVNVSGKPVEMKKWLLQCIRVMEQSIDVQNRDKYMAENLMWIRKQNPASKIVAWAHNMHIKETGNAMGKFLADSLKKDYLTIGFTFNKGRYTAMGNQGLTSYTAQESYPGTFEYFFDAIKQPVFILDLRKAKAQNSPGSKWLTEKLSFRSVGSMNMQNEFSYTDITSDFDLLIFINETGASELL